MEFLLSSSVGVTLLLLAREWLDLSKLDILQVLSFASDHFLASLPKLLLGRAISLVFLVSEVVFLHRLLLLASQLRY